MTHLNIGGGLDYTREINILNSFEVTVERVLGDKIRTHDSLASLMWEALVNRVWTHTDGDSVAYSYRSAGDLIAALRGEGTYIDWYCCVSICDEPFVVIQEALRLEGWSWKSATKEQSNLVGGKDSLMVYPPDYIERLSKGDLCKEIDFADGTTESRRKLCEDIVDHSTSREELVQVVNVLLRAGGFSVYNGTILTRDGIG